MPTILRKIARDIWARKLRTALVATSIFIGVLGVVTLVSASTLLVNQLESDIQEERLAMTQVILAARGAAQEIDNAAFLETVRALSDVTHAEARLVTKLQWRLPGDEDWQDGTLAAHSEPYADSYLQPTRLMRGRYPAPNPDGPPQIAIERRFAEASGLDIGDTLALRVLNRTAATSVVEAEITAIIFRPYEYSVGLAIGDPESLVFATFEDALAVSGVAGYNLLQVRYQDFAQAEANLIDLQATIRQQESYVAINASTTDPAENPQINQTRSTGNILTILAIIALVVSGFLIVNVVGAIVSEERRQIGIMKSLGASRSETFSIYAGVALAYGLLGTLPGVVLGIPGGYWAAQRLAGVFSTVLEDFAVVPQAIMLGLGLGLAVPLLAAMGPVWQGTRVSILEATLDRGIAARFGQSWLEQWLGNLPLPITLHQSVNNAYQKKFRLLLSGVTLTLASAAFMGIFSVFFGLTQLTETTFGTFGYQIGVSPSQRQDFEAVATLLQDNVSGITSIDPAVRLSIDIPGFEAPPVTAGPPGINATGWNTTNPAVFNLDLIEGTAWRDDPQRTGVVISSRIQEYTGLGMGDTIEITASGNTQSFPIIGVANWPFNDVWFKWRTLAEFGGLVNDGQPYPNLFTVILAGEEPTADEAEAKTEAINEVLLDNGISAQLDNVVASNELIVQIVVIFGVVLSLAAFLIAAVGGVGLLTTLSISVFERQKEIGVMRSVGATSGQVAQQFVIEGVVVGLVAWLVAVPISLGIRQVLLENLPFGQTFEISYSPLTLAVGLGGMLFLVVIASLWPSIAAARRTVSEILRYQ